MDASGVSGGALIAGVGQLPRVAGRCLLRGGLHRALWRRRLPVHRHATVAVRIAELLEVLLGGERDRQARPAGEAEEPGVEEDGVVLGEDVSAAALRAIQ